MNFHDEQQLVAEAQENVEKFEELYEIYFPKVYGFVAGKVNGRATAEDLTSEIFIKILQALPRYKYKGVPFGAWVFRIVRNHLKDYYAKNSKRATGNLEDTNWIKDEDLDRDPAKKTKRKNLKQNLIKSFSALKGQEEEVVRLKYFAELSNQEVADALGLSPNHVGVILFRALKKLKTAYHA